MPLLFGIFGIHNNSLSLAAELVLFFLGVIWVALIFWTFSDARRRIADPWVIGSATLASVLFPYLGTFVYMIVRPPEYLDDVRERELEMQAAEARLAEIGYHLCPHCDYEVERDYLRCPSCMRKLKDPCRHCGKPLEPAWKICPYCETEVSMAPAPVTRRARRRRDLATEQPVPVASSQGPDPGAVSAPETPGDRVPNTPSVQRSDTNGDLVQNPDPVGAPGQRGGSSAR